MNIYDVIIAGGGPAGLNAAVVLGRCRRKVLLFDTGLQRNRRSHGMHNYLTRDDILPSEFIKYSRKEALKYGVIFRETEIVTAKKTGNSLFALYTADKKIFYSKKIVVATGLRDLIPALEGIEEFYGRSVFHCPYCDGWEVKDKRIALYAKNKNGLDLALSLKTWSNDVSFFTDGRNYLTDNEIKLLQAYNIPLITARVRRLEGRNGKLKSVVMKDNSRHDCDALFFVNGYTQQCDLVKGLGCLINNKGVAVTNRLQETNISGVYVAGDAARDMHFVVVAAAEGARAAVTINKQLQKEERDQKQDLITKATKRSSTLSRRKLA
jgi:thioredoxin reductase